MMDARTNHLNASIKEVSSKVDRVKAQLATEIMKESDQRKESTAAASTKMEELAAHIG